MADVVSRKCPNCGAGLPRSGDATHVVCEYCRHEWDIQPPAPPPRPAPAPFVAPQVIVRIDPVRARAAAKGIGCTALLLPVLILAVVGFVVWRAAGPALDLSGGMGGLAAIGGPRMTWQKTVGFVQVNGDAIEDPILQVRFPDAEDAIHLAVFDGATMRALWVAGPFGTYSQGYQYTHTAVVGNRVVVTDFRGQAHLYDLASGARISQVPLPDRAKRICAATSGGTQVWVEAENGQNAILDTATGASQPAASPPWVGCTESTGLAAPEPPAAALEIQMPGFASEEVLADGGSLVAVGQRASGIRVPMAVGLAPDGRTPTWTLVLPTVDEALVEQGASNPTRFRLAGGRLFCAYSLSNDTGRLAAIDARTGARLWESELPPCCAHGVDVGEIHVGPTRVMTEQFLQVEVFDVHSGALVGRVTPR